MYPQIINDESLNGLDPQKAYTLGMEYVIVDGLLTENRDFDLYIYNENRDRISDLCNRHSVYFDMIPDDDCYLLRVK